jgi:hypothetical protein
VCIAKRSAVISAVRQFVKKNVEMYVLHAWQNAAINVNMANVQRIV